MNFIIFDKRRNFEVSYSHSFLFEVTDKMTTFFFFESSSQVVFLDTSFFLLDAFLICHHHDKNEKQDEIYQGKLLCCNMRFVIDSSTFLNKYAISNANFEIKHNAVLSIKFCDLHSFRFVHYFEV